MYSKGPNSSVYTIIYFWKKNRPYTSLLGHYAIIEIDFQLCEKSIFP